MEEVALEGWLGLGFVGGREYEPLLCATVYLLHATHVVVLLLPRIASLIPPFSQRRKAKLRELVSYPEIHDGRSETQPRAVRLPGPHLLCPQQAGARKRTVEQRRSEREGQCVCGKGLAGLLDRNAGHMKVKWRLNTRTVH